MQILSSGSFINLENREKIEQLIFTARELANAASQAEGFNNAGPSNGRLAVEMWQGAEYMCRDHEEATIKNIFLSNFLERLRDAGRAAIGRPSVVEITRPAVASQATPPPAVEPTRIPVSNSSSVIEEVAIPNWGWGGAVVPEPTATSDEFLGIVVSPDSNEEVIRTRSYADECLPESELEIVDKDSDLREAVNYGSKAEAEEAFGHDEATAELVEKSTSPPTASGELSNAPTARANKSIASIVVPAKEPYQLENCTVKVVVQILAEEHGIRKCVISLVTHDFFPEIAIAELNATSFIRDLPDAIEPVFERYKADFSVKVADKLKKEKSASKRQSAKSVDKSKAKSSSGSANETKNVTSTQSVVTQPVSTANDQQTSLFGS